jgi:hypothetical protein
VYVPLLHQTGLKTTLEQVGKAFTSQISSLLPDKTSCFEFLIPPETSLKSTLAHHQSRNPDKGYIGILRQSSQSEGATSHERGLASSAILHAAVGAASHEWSVPSNSLLMILEAPDFAQAHGRIVFLFLNNASEVELEFNSGWAGLDEYIEMQVWRLKGMEEVVRVIGTEPIVVDHEDEDEDDDGAYAKASVQHAIAASVM